MGQSSRGSAAASARRASAATLAAAAATLTLINISVSLLLRGGLEDRQLVGAVCAKRRTEELPYLLGVGALWQLEEDELRGLVGVQVGAVVQPLTRDLADPRVVVLRPVDPVRVEFVREIHIWVGVCGRGKLFFSSRRRHTR